jgi:hypothetical protein
LIHPTPVGLTIHVPKPGVLFANNEFGHGPVVVRLESPRSGVTPNVYVQLTLVSWSTLEATLKNELRWRPDKVVYVEGDSKFLDWAEVERAIDIIRGVPAVVVLLTLDSTRRVTDRKKH